MRAESRPGAPRISVVCAWYNRAGHIEETLASLLSQHEADFEIVLIDDGSPDPRVRDILSGFDDPRLRVIHQDNTGFNRAIVRAIAESRGAYIAIQGAGDISLPGRLAAQAALLDTDPAIGVVGTRYDNVVFGGPSHGLRTDARFTALRPELDHLLYGPNPLGHGTVMMRRAVYDAVGGYRPFFQLAQDRDLWIRMAPHCGIAILDDNLYERRLFQEDGVAADRLKLVLQKGLALFARQCHFDRLANGRDFVDRFGPNAAFFRTRSPELADFCARQAVQAFAAEDGDGAALLIRMAADERKTPLVVLAGAFLAVCAALPPLARLARRLLLGHGNARLWQLVRPVAK
ncbi:glycosyltransferase family 2 protein [Pelagibacterium lacus]|nr:glycosyltransferase [Pelagibacterium lacus]